MGPVLSPQRKVGHKGWFLTCQTPPPTQLSIEKLSRMKGCEGERRPYRASCFRKMIQEEDAKESSHYVASRKPSRRWRLSELGLGVNAVIRDGAAISGREGVPPPCV